MSLKLLLELIFSRSHTESSNTSVNSSCAQPYPGLLRGIYPPCQSRGWGICKFCAARGPGICQPQAFDTHAVSYQNITTQKILLEKQTDWLIFQGQDKNWRGLLRHVLDCMHAFLHCLSSRTYIARWGAIDVYQRVFGYWIKLLFILFEQHPFKLIKLFITVNFRAHN